MLPVCRAWFATGLVRVDLPTVFNVQRFVTVWRFQHLTRLFFQVALVQKKSRVMICTICGWLHLWLSPRWPIARSQDVHFYRKGHTNTSPEDLSETWGISVEQAQLTLNATTQRHGRSAIMPLSKKYRLDRMYEPKRLRCNMYMSPDTMDPRCVGMHGDWYCQGFGNKIMFCAAYPIGKKSSGEQTSIDKDFSKCLRK